MIRLRVGTHNGHTIYLSDSMAPTGSDTFIGSCVSPALAAAIVRYANEVLVHRYQFETTPEFVHGGQS